MPQCVEVINEDGYRYTRVSRLWALGCSTLPCFQRVRFPGYATRVMPLKINGVDAIIQLWKGSCPHFLGSNNMPGGIGAEVGVYRYYPPGTGPGHALVPKATSSASSGGAHAPDAAKPFLRSGSKALDTATHGASRKVHDAMHAGVDAVKDAAHEAASSSRTAVHRGIGYMENDSRFWWPAPELGANLQFELLWNNKTFFKTNILKSTYWLTQWMDFDDYARYQRLHPSPGGTPYYPNHFVERFWVNGVKQPDWVGCGP